MVRIKKSDAEKDRKSKIKETKKKAKEAKKAARKDARAEKNEARKDLKDAKHDTRGKPRKDRKDARKLAKQEKKDRVAQINQEKQAEIRKVRSQKRAKLAALRVPKAHHKTWTSYLRFQTVKALEIYKPTTLGHLKSICSIATENGLKVRAIGSGHSFSEIGQTDDIFVLTKDMNKPLTLGPVKRKNRFKPEHRDAPMAEFEVGRTVIDLSMDLEKTGHALVNQGTYDGQTFWGAVSTSTHGSGLGRGPFPNMVLSVVLVGEGGRTYRIEPAEGITDPQGWNERGIDELIQNDDAFYSVICSFGSMGIVYSAVITLREFYWLDEWTYISTWDTFKSAFSSHKDMRDFIAQWDTITLLVSPFKGKRGKKDGVSFKGEYPLSIIVRNETGERRRIGGTFTDSLAKAFEDIGIIHGKAPAEGRWFLPQAADLKRDDRWIARTAVKQTGKRAWKGEDLDPENMPPIKRRNKCYKIFPKGGKLFGGYGNEFGFPLKRTIAMVDRIIELADQAYRDGLYHTGPISVRFVAPATAYASPQYDQETVMFEVLMAKGTEDGPQALALIEEVLMAKGTEDGPQALALIEEALLHEKDVRVHWGLNMDRVSRHNMDFKRAYPKWPAFVKTFRKFNRQGTFRNSFTDRIGLS